MDNGYIFLRIDPHIWADESLNYPEKIMLNLVFSFTVQGKCCTITDSWVASKFGWPTNFVSELISILRLRGWLNVSHGPFGDRFISIMIPGETDPCKFDDTIYHVQV